MAGAHLSKNAWELATIPRPVGKVGHLSHVALRAAIVKGRCRAVSSAVDKASLAEIADPSVEAPPWLNVCP